MGSEPKPAEARFNLVKRIIFTYNTRHLTQTNKVRFYYALKGRDGKSGIIKHLNIQQLGRTVLLVDAKKAHEVHEFLNFWKCDFEEKEVFTRD